MSAMIHLQSHHTTNLGHIASMSIIGESVLESFGVCDALEDIPFEIQNSKIEAVDEKRPWELFSRDKFLLYRTIFKKI